MNRVIRRMWRALPALCLIAASCADGIVAPEPALSIDAAPPAHAGNANGYDVSAPGSEPCAPADSQDTVAEDSEPLPEDLCAVALYLPDAPRPGRTMEAAMIGPEGGSLRLGDFEIIVPAGAVSTPTRFSIALPAGGKAADHALAEFLPHNRTFALPLTIRLPRATTESAPGVPVTWWQKSTKTWIDQQTVEVGDGRIETSVDHFSYYATRRGVTIAGG